MAKADDLLWKAATAGAEAAKLTDREKSALLVINFEWSRLQGKRGKAGESTTDIDRNQATLQGIIERIAKRYASRVIDRMANVLESAGIAAVRKIVLKV